MAKEDIFGTLARVESGSRFTMNKDSRLYGRMKELTKGQRSLLDFILANMGEGTNSLVLSNKTLDKLLVSSNLSKSTIAPMVSTLKKFGFIDRGYLHHEILVHPTLAWNGSIQDVYSYHKLVEANLRGKKV